MPININKIWLKIKNFLSSSHCERPKGAKQSQIQRLLRRPVVGETPRNDEAYGLAFGMWKSHKETKNVKAYLNHLRGSRLSKS